MSSNIEIRIRRLHQIIDEMTDVRDLLLVQDVQFFGGAMMVRFAPRVARKHRQEFIQLLNVIFPTNGGGVRNGMTSEDFNEVLGESFLAVQVIAAGLLLGFWRVIESPAVIVSDAETLVEQRKLPARLVIKAVHLW